MNNDQYSQVTVYTDGSCLGNPGPGGWAAVLLWQGKRHEISGGFNFSTNNRMELQGAIEALALLKRPCRVLMHTDSKYLHDAVEKGWIARWLKNGWLTSDKKPVKNKDLWLTLVALMDKHQVSFQWVRGHADDPDNERCDQLAKEAAARTDLPADAGFAPA